MKKIFTIILLTFFSANVIAKGGAMVTIYNNGIVAGLYHASTVGVGQSFSEFIFPTDSIFIQAAGDTIGENKMLLIINNGDTLRSGPIYTQPIYQLTVTDTGHFAIHYTSDINNWDWYFDISYFSTTGIEEAESNSFQISPTLSIGIFKVKNDAQQRLMKITVSDDAGRIVYTSSTDFSEINLTRFSSGIYFYAVEDETMKVWRGKLIKN